MSCHTWSFAIANVICIRLHARMKTPDDGKTRSTICGKGCVNVWNYEIFHLSFGLQLLRRTFVYGYQQGCPLLNLWMDTSILWCIEWNCIDLSIWKISPRMIDILQSIKVLFFSTGQFIRCTDPAAHSQKYSSNRYVASLQSTKKIVFDYQENYFWWFLFG